ncbi:GNAT family N-acetyltransferase [Arthrobacter sp. FW306-05-C]|uniref:GNAT family N-acetyltransferase n=1 Tax=Arthrobacter sp. FW306-05-C TaxID=2879620 RepID=UPI001F19937F|nr:GNAT family N-acetyltransferase [Arthrobacter sp. FW306-05-C]UKA65474.1 GNAT family N-acetyltransferase [Arthrobacter sp. FW306-05-C]
MTARIRFATSADYPAVETIENAADRLLIDWLLPDRWPPAPSGGSRASEPGYVLVTEATDTGAVVGFVHVIESGKIAHLEQLSVLPEYGRRGYGRLLINAAKEEARERGHSRLTLRTYADVPWNAPFYSRAGFVEEDPSTDFHRKLVRLEDSLDLARYGRRVQMVAVLK